MVRLSAAHASPPACNGCKNIKQPRLVLILAPSLPALMLTPARFMWWNLMSLAILTARLSAGPWEPLFNGRDLTGWRTINGTAPFTVVAGAIVGTTVVGSPNSFLATDKTYGDFIFECEVKQAGGRSNSGIQFRGVSEAAAENGRVRGYQLEIDPSERAWTGGIYDEARRGWFYPVTLNPTAQSAYHYGEWNQLRIEAIGSSLRTWVNGRPVAHVIDAQTATGFLALQIHGIKNNAAAAGALVHWRNLRIQTTDLSPTPPDDIFIRNTTPNNVSAAEQLNGWRLLWDGHSSAGWRGIKDSRFPTESWQIAAGVLTVVGNTQGNDIITTAEFSTFELQWDFQMTPGANSGVKYFLNPVSAGYTGLEYQLLDDERHLDAKLGLNGNRTLGSLYDLIPRGTMPGGLAIVPRVGEWQHARIVVTQKNRVEHWLNGIKVVDYERGSPAWTAAVARSKYAKMPGFGLAEKSPILLQDHGDKVQFRSLKIRPL